MKGVCGFHGFHASNGIYSFHGIYCFQNKKKNSEHLDCNLTAPTSAKIEPLGASRSTLGALGPFEDCQVPSVAVRYPSGLADRQQEHTFMTIGF